MREGDAGLLHLQAVEWAAIRRAAERMGFRLWHRSDWYERTARSSQRGCTRNCLVIDDHVRTELAGEYPVTRRHYRRHPCALRLGELDVEMTDAARAA